MLKANLTIRINNEAVKLSNSAKKIGLILDHKVHQIIYIQRT